MVMAPLIFAAVAMRLRARSGNSGWLKGGGCARAGSSHSGLKEGTSLGEVGGTAGAMPSSALAVLAAVAALAALVVAALALAFLILLPIVSVEDV